MRPARRGEEEAGNRALPADDAPARRGEEEAGNRALPADDAPALGEPPSREAARGTGRATGGCLQSPNYQRGRLARRRVTRHGPNSAPHAAPPRSGGRCG